MAKTTRATGWGESASGNCTLLHVDYGEFSGNSEPLPFHAHSYWQMEILDGRKLSVWTEVSGKRESWELRPGEAFLFPPGLRHSFSYPAGPARFFSYKFRWTGSGISGKVPGGEISNAMIGLLRRHTSESIRFGREDWIPRVIGALMDLANAPALSKDDDRDLVGRVRQWTESQDGYSANVKKLARELGFSPGYLSSRFRKETGEPLKKFLDAARARTAARFLAYADLRVTEVARRLDFPDVLAFSRFCKKNLGKSPRLYRRWKD